MNNPTVFLTQKQQGNVKCGNCVYSFEDTNKSMSCRRHPPKEESTFVKNNLGAVVGTVLDDYSWDGDRWIKSANIKRTKSVPVTEDYWCGEFVFSGVTKTTV